jgi:hypothetical protein
MRSLLNHEILRHVYDCNTLNISAMKQYTHERA